MKIDTDTQRQSNLLKWELAPEIRYSRDVLKYKGVAKTFVIGELVGANGVAPVAANDIVGVVLENTTALADVDAAVIVLARTGVVSVAGLKLGTLALADVEARLLTLGIKVLKAV